MTVTTVVEFRTGIRDKLGYVARWLGVAVDRGARVRVLGDARELQALSQLLWTTDKESFVPHLLCLAAAHDAGMHAVSSQAYARTPVWLGSGQPGVPPPDLMVNLGVDVTPDSSQYQRIIEVVSLDEDEVQAGRRRWADYRRLGLEPVLHRPGAQGSDQGD